MGGGEGFVVDESRADVLYVLCLMQGAFLLLAGVGELLLMGGNPAYLLLPVAKLVLLLWLATKVVKGRRWAAYTLIVVQVVTLTGFQLQVVGGALIPALDFTLNLVVLLTNLALPIAVIALAVQVLTRAPSNAENVKKGTFLTPDPGGQR
jgi:hypothetical protein